MISITYHHHRAIKRERDGGTGGGGKRKACSTRGPRKNGDGRTAPGPRWMPGQTIHICGNEPRQMMAFFARFSFDAGGHGHSHRGRHLARVSVDDDTANPFFNGTGSFCCAFHPIFPQLYLLYKIVASQKRHLDRARTPQPHRAERRNRKSPSSLCAPWRRREMAFPAKLSSWCWCIKSHRDATPCKKTCPAANG